MLKEVKEYITKIDADVIINAANTELIHGGGVSLAIVTSLLGK
jgi:O-acetyl-ADP-ribose deacetylase (regulator of RNase III)